MKLRKALDIAVAPSLWRPLSRGVATATEHLASLRHLQIGTCLDVGANKGQFSLAARQLWPAVRIIAFEPLTEAVDIYREVVPGPVEVHSCAVGTATGSRELFLATRADSSSLLRPSQLQFEAFGVGEASRRSVPVYPLSRFGPFTSFARPILLKVDTQGSELDVLESCGNELKELDFVFLETSFVQLYAGQPLVAEVIEFAKARGFKVLSISNVVSTKRFGPTQADVLFGRDTP